MAQPRDFSILQIFGLLSAVLSSALQPHQTITPFLALNLSKALVEPLMASDQHRVKRSRLYSTEGNNDRSHRDNHDDESEPSSTSTSQGRISDTTSALGNISLQDKKLDNQSEARYPVSHSTLDPRSSNGNTAGFLNHSTFQHRNPTADFSFRSFSQSKSDGEPPSSDLDASGIAAQVKSDLDRPSERPSLPFRSNIVPLHGVRDTKVVGGLSAGPSTKQIERDAIKPPPEKNSLSYSPSIHLGCSSDIVRQTRADTEAINAFNRKACRPQPIYIPASEINHSNNSFAAKFALLP